MKYRSGGKVPTGEMAGVPIIGMGNKTLLLNGVLVIPVNSPDIDVSRLTVEVGEEITCELGAEFTCKVIGITRTTHEGES